MSYSLENDCERSFKKMAKAGMRRPSEKEPHGTESNRKTHKPKNDVQPVPEISGKAKAKGDKARPIT
jgi:hypothetical protein